MDLYKEEMKMYAREKKRFELNCRCVYLLVKEQCSPNMISELKGFDIFDTIEEEFHLVNLLKLIKKICYNYKTQDDPIYAIIKAGASMYHTKQRKDETTKDYALLTENRLQVYTAIGGTVLNPGVSEHVSQDLYTKKYSLLDPTEKEAFDKSSIERVMAMIIFSNADSDCFGKVQKEIHDDHLKNQEKGASSYQKTITGVLRLLTHHSEVKEPTQKQRKPRDTEIAFTQEGREGDGPRGFGHWKGNCRKCGKEGHHGWECPDKDKNDDSKKEEDEKKPPANKTETGKNKTTLATHGSTMNEDYCSEDEFNICLVTVVTSEMTMTGGESKGELNLTELELILGQSSNAYSPIPKDWCILDNQSTINVFRNGKYLKNIRQVENHVVIKCNAGTRKTNWVGDFPGYPEAIWYDPGGIANII